MDRSDAAPMKIARELRTLAKFDGEKVDGDGKEPVEVMIAEVTDDGLVPLAHWRETDGVLPPRVEEFL